MTSHIPYLSAHWVEFDGYHTLHQLVDDKTGRILAEVRGSDFEKQAGWAAWDYGNPASSVLLGRFISVGCAKTAAIAAILSQRESGNGSK